MIRKKRPAWNHWTVVQEEKHSRSENRNKHPHVKCNYCLQELKRAVPKRMQDHLDKCPRAPDDARSNIKLEKLKEFLIDKATYSSHLADSSDIVDIVKYFNIFQLKNNGYMCDRSDQNNIGNCYYHGIGVIK